MVERLTPTHHALMTAWIARALINAAGEEDGIRVFRKAVVRYGNQRGRRMALRASANGHPPTMVNYLAYGEWAAVKKEMVMKIIEKSPHARVHVLKCPWHTAWKENNLLPYGCHFCKEIDAALVQGFNPSLVLEINGTRSNGAAYCDFRFRDADLTPLKLLGLAWKKTIRPGKRALMPWEYHVGHLFKTLGDVITEEMGENAAEIMSTALKDFIDQYGEAAGRIITQYRTTDFNILP